MEGKRTVNGKRDTFSMLITPWQYENKFYELSSSVEGYERWIDEAQYRLRQDTWIVVEIRDQGRKVSVGVDSCYKEQDQECACTALSVHAPCSLSACVHMRRYALILATGFPWKFFSGKTWGCKFENPFKLLIVPQAEPAVTGD